MNFELHLKKDILFKIFIYLKKKDFWKDIDPKIHGFKNL